MPAFPEINADRAWQNCLARQLMQAGHEIYFIYCGPEIAPEHAREMKQFFSRYLFVPGYNADLPMPVDLERVKIAIQLLTNGKEGFIFCNYWLLQGIFEAAPGNWIKVLIPFFTQTGEVSDFHFYRQQEIHSESKAIKPRIANADVAIFRDRHEDRHLAKIGADLLKLSYNIGNHPEAGLPEAEFAEFCNALARKQKRVLIVIDYPFWMVRYGGHAPGFIVMANYLKERYTLEIFFHGNFGEPEKKEAARLGLADLIHRDQDYQWDSGRAREPDESDFLPEPMTPHYRASAYSAFANFLDCRPKFDSLIVFTLFNSYFIKALPYSALTILDTHDCWSRRNYIYNGSENTLISADQESAIYSRYDSTIMVEGTETFHARQLLPNSISICCPFTFPANDLPFPKDGIHFGFIAPAHIYDPIKWFMDEVWIYQDRPDAKLHIFGTVCERIVDCPPNVVLHGIVKSEERIHSFCNVMLNPAFIATGISTKSVMSLAYGRPLIATSCGARGVSTKTGNGVFVANSREEFIRAMQLFSHDAGMLEQFSRDALRFSRQEFTVSNAYKPLAELIESY